MLVSVETALNNKPGLYEHISSPTQVACLYTPSASFVRPLNYEIKAWGGIGELNHAVVYYRLGAWKREVL